MQVAQPSQTLATVLCCMCGGPMTANAANTCAQCLQNQHDVTGGLAKQGVVCRCKGCERYQRDANGWLECGRESRELLAFCLKKIKGLKQVKLVDASFIWTEPHSRRIKVKLTVQKEVVNGVVLQQSCVIEFVEQNRMCEDCHRSEANLTWNSVVQVRQRVNHKRTFLFLEQLILKHNACDRALKIDPMPMGVDFYFSACNDAVRFQDFLESVVPTRYKRSKKIISADIKSNTANFNHTFAVEIVPICKDDLVCLPIQQAKKAGNISQIALCTQVSSSVRLIDPKTCQICEITSEGYFQKPFRSIGNARQLIEFIVLDVQPVGEVMDNLPQAQQQQKVKKGKKRRAQDSRTLSDHRMRSKKHQLCDVEVAKVSDFGVNDKTYLTRSHLGYILNAGDSVMGYDISGIIFNDADAADLRKKEEEQMQDIVLVRKHYPKYRSKNKTRAWKLKALAAEAPDTPGVGVGASMSNKDDEKDFEMFMQDIEEDEEMRSKVNLYKNPKMKPAPADTMEDDVEPDAPQINLDELLDEMKLNEEEQQQETNVDPAL